MSGDVTADGTGEEAGDHSPASAAVASGVLHVLAGHQVSGAGLRAVCRCGHTGPPRALEDRAAAPWTRSIGSIRCSVAFVSARACPTPSCAARRRSGW
jgi:hypothetical protein